MEQNKINAIIIAGIIVVGAGTWAGPMMTVQTQKQFQLDLDNIQTAQVGFYEDQGWAEWDEFGIGDYKDEIFFFDHDAAFAEEIFFGGPIVPLEAFSQELVPDDVTGIDVITNAAADLFGNPVTFIEMRGCDLGDANIGAGPSRLFDECEPAILDKVFIMAPAAGSATDKFRVQVAVCEDQDMNDHVNDPNSADTVVTNDECTVAGQTAFDNAVILLDVILQPGIDHTQGFIIERGAVPAFTGSTLMVRAADNDGAETNTLRVWVGVIRTGDEGAFSFINPIEFGGVAPDSCVVFEILTNGVGQNNVEIDLNIFGLGYFGTTATVNAVAGILEINNIPDDVFAIIDVFIDIDGDGFPEVFFIDRFFDVDFQPTRLNSAGATCVNVTFDTLNAPQF